MTDDQIATRALRQNEVCKTLITIDLAVVAATLSILGSSRPIGLSIGLGAVALVVSSMAFVASMIFLINAPDTNGKGSRSCFAVGLVLAAIGYVIMAIGFLQLEAPKRDERISIEALPDGMTLHVPGLCRQAVTAVLPGGKAQVIPFPNETGTAAQKAACRKKWRLEADLQSGERLIIQPTP